VGDKRHASGQHRATEVTGGRLRAVLVVMSMCVVLVVGANAALTVALPTIARSLSATQADLTWIISGYVLTFAAVLLISGTVADKFGRRLVMLLGILVFGFASLASAWSVQPETLIALRAVAGLGAAAVFPVTLSVLVDVYPEHRRGYAIGVWATVGGTAAMIGLVVSGLLLEFFWWGSVQVFFGVAALVLVPALTVLVPSAGNGALPLDPLGALLSLVGLGALVFAVIEGPETGWDVPRTLLSGALGVSALVAFVVWELRSSAPLLDVRLFRDRNLTAGCMLIWLQFFAAQGFFLLAPQYLQSVLTSGPLEAALSLLPLGVGIAPTAALAPRLVARWGAHVAGALGLLILTASLVALGFVDAGAHFWQFAAALVVFGFGSGLALMPGTALIMAGLPADRRTLASALNDVVREVGAALGGAVLGTVLLVRYRDQLAPALRDAPAQVADAANSGIAAAVALTQEMGPPGGPLLEAARDAFTAGYQLALWSGAAVLVVGALACIVLARPSAARVPAPASPTPVP